LALNPDDEPLYYVLGQTFKACGRDTDASRAFRRVKELKEAAVP